MECYLCGENLKIRGANSKKVASIWIHKLCPAEAARRRAKKKEKRNARKNFTDN